MRLTILGLFIVLFIGSTSIVSADVIIPGQKRVPVNVIIGYQGILPSCGIGHKVEAGDTLSGISKIYFGDTKHIAKIIAANKGLSPDKIKPGQILWIPPRIGTADDWQEIYTLSNGELKPLLANKKISTGSGNPASRWWLVSTLHSNRAKIANDLKEMNESRKARLGFGHALLKLPYVAVSEPFFGITSLRESDSRSSVEQIAEISGIKGRDISVRNVSSVGTQKMSQIVHGKEVLKSSGIPLMPMLLLLAGIGFLGLTFRMKTKSKLGSE